MPQQSCETCEAEGFRVYGSGFGEFRVPGFFSVQGLGFREDSSSLLIAPKGNDRSSPYSSMPLVRTQFALR